MGELQQILPAMQADYPCARLSDHVKLIYQNEFGCAHLAKGGMSPEDLRREAAAARRGRSLFESIGTASRRIYRPLWQTCYDRAPPEDTLWRLHDRKTYRFLVLNYKT